MTREGMIRELKNVIQTEQGKCYDTCTTNVRIMATDCLHFIEETIDKPVPDPETGLVKCGCGGKAKVWPSDLRQAMVTDYEVGCSECAMTTGWVRGKQENAMKVWNTAMGYKEGA